MARGERAGWASAGCGAFSLLGLLIGVGLTVWLGSRVVDEVGGPVGPAAHGDATPTLLASPATAITDRQRITVDGAHFDIGSTVTIVQCARVRTADRCDPSTRTKAKVTVLGGLQSSFAVHRALVLDAMPLDCAAPGSRCFLRASTDAPRARSADAALTITAATPPPPSPTTTMTTATATAPGG
ncbi:MAG: hypothetical protein JWM89_1779 [Acidimicrobiales bacterium]|nr:hypothetical protein [Acidimicrobiales bacterium]